MSQILPHGRKRSATLITAAGLQMVVVQTKQNAALRWLPLRDPAQLARHVEITDVVPCTPGLIEKWADELASLIHERCGNNRIIIDRLDGDARAALESRGIEVGFDQDVIEQARRIKTVDEQKAQAHSALVCETALSMMHEQTRPGASENELWATLVHVNAALGGDYIETRLVVSGTKTNPWLSEAGTKNGVKLEEMVRITATGTERVATFPFEDELLAA